MQTEIEKAEARGSENFARFMQIANGTWPSRPEWYAMVLETDIFLDMVGVDAIAFIRYSNEDYFSMVPIQVKSSVFGLTDYFEQYQPQLEAQKLPLPVGIIVNPIRTVKQVRERLRLELEHVRAQNIRYDLYFEHVGGRAAGMRQRPPRGPAGRDIIAFLIRERESRKQIVRVPQVVVQRIEVVVERPKAEKVQPAKPRTWIQSVGRLWPF